MHRLGTLLVSHMQQAQHFMAMALAGSEGILQVSHMLQAQKFTVTALEGVGGSHQFSQGLPYSGNQPAAPGLSWGGMYT